jgi:hypothetical protein
MSTCTRLREQLDEHLREEHLASTAPCSTSTPANTPCERPAPGEHPCLASTSRRVHPCEHPWIWAVRFFKRNGAAHYHFLWAEVVRGLKD